MSTLKIYPGKNKQHQLEKFSCITLEKGNRYAIVGNTGSGKSRLMKDIELLVQCDSITQRKIISTFPQQPFLIAHLSQHMRFVLDMHVSDFLYQHAKCHQKTIDIEMLILKANKICQEPIHADTHLHALSGGQSRALMIVDIAYICDSPIVLLDEIENAGIDKEIAFSILCEQQKLILIVTHDVHTALSCSKRIVMENGGITDFITTSHSEKTIYQKLEKQYRWQKQLQNNIRRGIHL